MPGSQLAARIYTTNGAPTVSLALTHTTHECNHSPLISTRRRKVRDPGREEGKERVTEGEQEASYLLEWYSTNSSAVSGTQAESR